MSLCLCPSHRSLTCCPSHLLVLEGPSQGAQVPALIFDQLLAAVASILRIPPHSIQLFETSVELVKLLPPLSSELLGKTESCLEPIHLRKSGGNNGATAGRCVSHDWNGGQLVML